MVICPTDAAVNRQSAFLKTVYTGFAVHANMSQNLSSQIARMLIAMGA